MQFDIRPASPELTVAVSEIVARQMAVVLSHSPRLDLCDETRCAECLLRAGFASGTVFVLCNEARFLAWKLIDPHLANRADWMAYQFRNAPSQLAYYPLRGSL